MSAKTPMNISSYLPVAWEYLETVEEEIIKKTSGKIFYFDNNNQLEQVEGQIIKLIEEKGEGVFVLLEEGGKVRMDRIITLFGKIGAAYEEYDAYANACLDCKGD